MLAEDNLVVPGKRIPPARVWSGIGFHVVPLDARPTDRKRCGARPALRIRSPYQVPDIPFPGGASVFSWHPDLFPYGRRSTFRKVHRLG
jgi:hypothetical protein